MKTHYDLLGVAPTADAEEIKKAFRREIARYHPDKVQHLGKEFQEMAAVRAAELTAAYKTLTDPELRAQYDTTAAVPAAPFTAGPGGPAAAPVPGAAPPPPSPDPVDPGAGAGRLFERERAGRDDIVRRAVLLRLREVLDRVVGQYEEPRVKGFDLTCVPKARPSLFTRSVPPRVLARLTGTVDGAEAAEAWNFAARSRVPMVKGAALVVLVFGSKLARPIEILQALDPLYRKAPPGTPEPLFVVPVNFTDWTAQIPPGAPEAVTKLVTALKDYV
ncbi:MAG: J domain-containing protein [Acidobacteriota bacterium]